MSEYICKQDILETKRGAYVSLGQVAYEPVQELIRCRDCRFFHGRCERDPIYFGEEWPTDPDGFCSWAERPYRNIPKHTRTV